jgi:AI-2 transport system permease protein
MIQILKYREAVVIALLVVLVLVIGVFSPNSWPAALINVANSSLVLMLIAIGEMFVILTRGIDVSVGAIAGISAVVLGTVSTSAYRCRSVSCSHC